MYKQMIWKIISKIFLLCILVTPSLGSSYQKKDSYPSIHDVVSFTRPNRRMDPRKEKINVESDLIIDIEKLDMERLKKDDSAFRRQIMGDLGGDILLPHDKKKDARRVQKFYPAKGGLPEYYRADELQYRTKMADCMLQLIYMARSKVKAFLARGFIKKGSNEYRVGFMVRKLEALYYRANRYLTFMALRQIERKWDTESVGLLTMHHKVVMAHYDFDRLYFMQMALHERMEVYAGHSIHSMSLAMATTPTIAPM